MRRLEEEEDPWIRRVEGCSGKEMEAGRVSSS